VDLARWNSTITLAGTVLAAAVAAWVLAALMARVAAIRRRHEPPCHVTADRLCRWPWIVAVTAVAAETVLHAGYGFNTGWRQAGVISVIVASCWLARRLLLVGEQMLFIRLRMDVADNRRVRRARTQISLLRRGAGSVVVLVGGASSLMTFPSLRTFGGSLLASAGLVGILAGLAAQTTMGNVFAGLQLAFTDAVRIDDVVVVEDEWGWIEEITLTYVVVHIWDERRLVLPTSYFTTTTFQNWTRNQARILGSVILNLDYATPVPALREQARKVIEASPLWDGKDWVLQVIDTTETTMVIRVLASAHDAPTCWDLRCEIREALLAYLQHEHPQSLPARRIVVETPHGRMGAAPLGAPAGHEVAAVGPAVPTPRVPGELAASSFQRAFPQSGSPDPVGRPEPVRRGTLATQPIAVRAGRPASPSSATSVAPVGPAGSVGSLGSAGSVGTSRSAAGTAADGAEERTGRTSGRRVAGRRVAPGEHMFDHLGERSVDLREGPRRSAHAASRR
jgi:small-conductance mechanosensitive channel